ncbi:flagellar basal body P-ring protein FlgI [Vibrio sp. D431a]|uniref:flagellar basal body P-ring protein FlgI n=1 Tax=Vibrio sp. D431a TaxID=2837388 RepID=UPI002556507B|nr:flagellar basal body P-ring protein FlgI [Vibrio sp. D431a]MDK9793912.1 flagellar basal body P-ring protein FlgI [Vibrio sp. D431a]
MKVFKNIKSVVLLVALLGSTAAHAERVGDMTSIAGARDNQLQGVGLVVGLPNTGDRTKFTAENATTLIQKYGIKVPNDVSLRSRNVAFVMVNATLPPFAKNGQRIDVTVSSMGDAKSLRGGTLVTSSLLGLNGKTYAITQGQVLVDGFSATGLDGSTLDVNPSAVGRIPEGATVEVELDNSSIFNGDHVTLNLNRSDFAAVNAIEKAINEQFGKGTAKAFDAGSLKVLAPRDQSSRIEFITLIQNVDFQMPEPEANVTINSRSQTVTFTQNVKLSPIAISLGNIVVNISESQDVSQPAPLGGETVVVQNSQIKIENMQTKLAVIERSGTLQDLVTALNAVGASNKDIASVIQQLKQAGALKAKVFVL